MCYQLVEIYSACKCLYYQHAVDRCGNYGRRGHGITERTIFVGYACHLHSHGSDQAHGGHNSILSLVTGRPTWLRSPLAQFESTAWIGFLYSFRARGNLSPTRRPSQLSLLFVGHDRFNMSSSAPPVL
ncbi:hypothetical protein Micbo1qcDRAFT_205188 [Microdochium bolleyi]|uniref:Uncharacterized protein n=1 Tax=Microdochium bolleyi TaxID=196109 RepID=A0A136J271_9PEZI|nr:hypothetical protein Micbo1qcDRAFT_205188 [Microdochium bolleyi]